MIKSKELRVGGDYTVTIGGPLKFGSVFQTIQKADKTNFFLKYNHLFKFREDVTNEGNYSLTAKGSKAELIDGSWKVESGESLQLSSRKTLTAYASSNSAIHSSKDGYYSAGKKIKIVAGDEIELKCGKSTIKMTSSGHISINGKKIDLN